MITLLCALFWLILCLRKGEYTLSKLMFIFCSTMLAVKCALVYIVTILFLLSKYTFWGIEIIMCIENSDENLPISSQISWLNCRKRSERANGRRRLCCSKRLTHFDFCCCCYKIRGSWMRQRRFWTALAQLGRTLSDPFRSHGQLFCFCFRFQRTVIACALFIDKFHPTISPRAWSVIPAEI